MGSDSDSSAPLVNKVNVTVDASNDGFCPTKKSKSRVSIRIHKAEREKLKRDRLNELFFDLANALELAQLNSGKACVLNEATRLLKEWFSQIESLKKENASLLSESHYVTIEKHELREENSALESQIEILQNELGARAAHSKPDLSVPPPEFQPEMTSQYAGDSYGLPAVEPTLHHAAVVVLPFRPNLDAYTTPDATQFTPKPASKVSKPHARYPNAADYWPSKLLVDSISTTRDQGPRNT